MIRIVLCVPSDGIFELWDEVLPQLYTPEQVAMKKQETADDEWLRICLIAFRDEAVAGRLCLYYNPSIAYEGGKTMLIGKFECVEDESIASALLQSAGDWASQQDVAYLMGPMNGSTWHNYRFTITEGLPPFFSEALHPDYYPDYFIREGFGIAHRYHTRIAASDAKAVDEDLARMIDAEGVRIRPIDIDKYEEELKKIHALCAVAFAGNELFSAASEAAFLQQYRPYRSLMDPRFVKLAEKEGVVIAFLFSFEDRYAPRRLVIKTVAKLPSAPKGLVTLLSQQVYAAANAAGITTVLHAYMHERNASQQLSGAFGGQPYKAHVLLVKKLADD